MTQIIRKQLEEKAWDLHVWFKITLMLFPNKMYNISQCVPVCIFFLSFLFQWMWSGAINVRSRCQFQHRRQVWKSRALTERLETQGEENPNQKKQEEEDQKCRENVTYHLKNQQSKKTIHPFSLCSTHQKKQDLFYEHWRNCQCTSSIVLLVLEWNIKENNVKEITRFPLMWQAHCSVPLFLSHRDFLSYEMSKTFCLYQKLPEIKFELTEEWFKMMSHHSS